MDIFEAKQLDHFIRGYGIVLRPYKDEYFELRRDLRLDVETALAQFFLETYGEEAYRELFRESKGFACMIFEEETGEFVGEILINDCTQDDWELGWNIVSSKRRQGYLKRAARLFLRRIIPFARGHRLIAEVSPTNKAGLAAAMSLGGTFEGFTDSMPASILGKEWADRFVEEHPELVTSEVKVLAAQLDIDPYELLTKNIVLSFSYYQLDHVNDDIR